jgi:hypothetical protein
MVRAEWCRVEVVGTVDVWGVDLLFFLAGFQQRGWRHGV